MAALVIPDQTRIEIPGPWLLDDAQLKEFEVEVNHVWEELNAAAELSLDEKVERVRARRIQDQAEFHELFPENEPPLLPDRARLRTEIIQQYPHDRNQKKFELGLNSGAVISVGSLDEAKHLTHLVSSDVRRLSLTMERDAIGVALTMERSWSGYVSFKLDTTPNGNPQAQISYARLRHWAERHRPSQKLVWWELYGRLSWSVVVLMALIMVLAVEIVGPKGMAKRDWREIADQILSQGINDSNRDLALEAILATSAHTNILPSRPDEISYPDLYPALALLFGVAIVSLLLSIKPTQPHFALGPVGAKKVQAWRRYSTWLFRSLPLWFLLTPLGAILGERVTGHL